jgi:hypothetical protein
MISTGENQRTWRKTSHSATVSTTNHTWIYPGANPGLRGERPATDRLRCVCVCVCVCVRERETEKETERDHVHPPTNQLTNSVAPESAGSSWYPILSQLDPLYTLQPISLKSILIPSSHLRLGLPNSLFPSGFPTRTLYTFLSPPMRATCPVHLIFLHLICLMTFGNE